MMKFLRTISPLVAGLGLLPAALHAQTGYVASGGSLSITLAANVSQLFASQNIAVSYLGAADIRRGETFNVTGGGVSLSDASGSAFTDGAMTFTEGSNTVTLNQFDLLATTSNAYITADVVINGDDQGRYPVFLLVSNLYTAPVAYGKYASGAVRFSINPDFQSEFADYIPISGLDPSSSLGTFALNVTITKKK